MRILVLQLTRMGDALQTSPLIRSLRRQHPDAHITFMVRRMAKAVAERNPDVDETLIYDDAPIYLALRRGDSDRFLWAYEEAERLCGDIRARNFDIVYNCTHSIGSAMLLRLADVPRVTGAHLSDDWRFVLRGGWANYFYTSVLDRQHNDLNLCDIVEQFADDAPATQELVLDVRPDDEFFVESLLEKKGIPPGENLICLQLGASQNDKRWPVANFAALARNLAEKYRARIVLLGVKEEASLGGEFEKLAPNLAVPLYGETTIPQAAALLKRARLLVTNDTGVMHIAAAVKCPIVLVSIGFVHFRETGPYGEGFIAIERVRKALGQIELMPKVRERLGDIPPECVQAAVDLALLPLEQRMSAQFEDSAEFRDVELHVSGFASDGRLEWYPIVRRPISENDLLRMAYRAMWLDHLGGVSQARQIDAMTRMLARFRLDDKCGVAATIHDCCERFGKTQSLARRGIEITQELLDALSAHRDLARAQDLARQLTRLDEEIRVQGEVHPQCRQLVLIARFERDNLEGLDPLVLAQRTLQIYEDLSKRAGLVQDKLLAIKNLCNDLSC